MRKKYNNSFLLLIVAFVLGYSASLQSAPASKGRTPKLLYKLSVDQEFWQKFYVNIAVENISKPRIIFGMPKWMPGAYILLNFGEKVNHFTATTQNGEKLTITQLAVDKWEVDCSGISDVLVSYDVSTTEHGFMGKALDSTGAIVQGPAVWMYLDELEHLPVTVNLELPDYWHAATSLEGDSSGHDFRAKNYDELVDSPISMGNLRKYSFRHMGKPHTISFRGEGDFQTKDFINMVKDIVAYQTKLFGEAPYDNYAFLFTLYPGERGGGGLEHANSTTIGLSALELMRDVENTANIIAHEFFHLWNVKRIRPKVLLPYNYDQPVRTKALWFCEGITSYYADITLVRAGIWSEEEFLDSQEQQIEYLQENPDRKRTSVEQASLKSWDEGYGGTGISYYTKGQLVGLLLDFRIRDVTNNKRSLDDVMRFMNWWYAKRERGYEEDEIIDIVNAITQTDMTPFFDFYISGTVELPYTKVLGIAGLNASIQSTQVPDIGRLRVFGKRNRIFGVDANGPAGRAGLRRGDLVITVDGDSIRSYRDIQPHLDKKARGDTLVVVADRDGANIRFNVIVDTCEKIDCEITRDPNATFRQKMILESWLKG